MSLAGFKKQINKANQFMSEKVGGAKGTSLDENYMELEKQTDVLAKLIDDLISKTQEYLQPNPVSRAKMSSMKTFSKMRGQSNKHQMYPQPEGTLGEHMVKHGRDLGEDNVFASCVIDAGEAFKHLAQIKYGLEDSVKQNFIEPLKQIESKDLKEIHHHRKKLSGRRLDYDCKRRKQDKGSSISEEQIQVAESKFEESKSLAETAMYNLLSNDTEHISQVLALIDSCLSYHKEAVSVLDGLSNTLQAKLEEAKSKPRQHHIPKSVSIRRHRDSDDSSSAASFGAESYDMSSQPPAYQQPSPDTVPAYTFKQATAEPWCKAIYDFEPENEGELGFSEGDNITLTNRIDENWLEGRIGDREGYFPVNYVDIMVDLE